MKNVYFRDIGYFPRSNFFFKSFAFFFLFLVVENENPVRSERGSILLGRIYRGVNEEFNVDRGGSPCFFFLLSV